MSIWKSLLLKEWDEYLQYGSANRFSHKGHELARWFGDVISLYKGTILDVGCGVIFRPEYMHDDADWYGVDPLGEHLERGFSYVCSKAEELPFSDNTFDLVVFATSLNHLENPKEAVKEAYRVLKPNGRVAYWGGFVSEKRYAKWRKTGGMADSKHMWAFTEASLKELFYKFQEEKRSVNGKSHAIIYKKCK